jgi:hypothetical protein
MLSPSHLFCIYSISMISVHISCYLPIDIKLRLGLKRKLLILFSRKAKISKHLLTFSKISYCENFCFRKSFCKNFSFRKSFCKNFCEQILFLGWFSRKVSFFVKDFAKNYRFCEKIFPQCFRSGYIFRWLLDPDPDSECKAFMRPKIFAKTFMKPKFFAKTFAKTKIFAKNFTKMKMCNCSTFPINVG